MSDFIYEIAKQLTSPKIKIIVKLSYKRLYKYVNIYLIDKQLHHRLNNERFDLLTHLKELHYYPSKLPSGYYRYRIDYTKINQSKLESIYINGLNASQNFDTNDDFYFDFTFICNMNSLKKLNIICRDSYNSFSNGENDDFNIGSVLKSLNLKYLNIKNSHSQVYYSHNNISHMNLIGLFPTIFLKYIKYCKMSISLHRWVFDYSIDEFKNKYIYELVLQIYSDNNIKNIDLIDMLSNIKLHTLTVIVSGDINDISDLYRLIVNIKCLYRLNISINKYFKIPIDDLLKSSIKVIGMDEITYSYDDLNILKSNGISILSKMIYN